MWVGYAIKCKGEFWGRVAIRLLENEQLEWFLHGQTSSHIPHDCWYIYMHMCVLADQKSIHELYTYIDTVC